MAATETATSKRGIPAMEVIEDVESWLSKEKLSVEEALKLLKEKLGKYEYVEATMTSQKENDKLPDYDNSLKILDALEEKKEKGEPFQTTYLLSEEVYTKAKVDNPEKVCIWLGAGVMAEYDLAEANELFTKNRDGVVKIISELTSELAYVKDQITTTQVNIAHVYNHGVAKKKAAGGK